MNGAGRSWRVFVSGCCFGELSKVIDVVSVSPNSTMVSPTRGIEPGTRFGHRQHGQVGSFRVHRYQVRSGPCFGDNRTSEEAV